MSHTSPTIKVHISCKVPTKSQFPHIQLGVPPGEADDKCISLLGPNLLGYLPLARIYTRRFDRTVLLIVRRDTDFSNLAPKKLAMSIFARKKGY